jgi:peptidoglycan/xylan/chitin deacetylase (PgdA/CDA1 family)
MNDLALVSLTFDDGLRCQLEQAVPTLDKHGLAATFFLVANSDPIHTDGHRHPNWKKTTWSKGDIQFLRGMMQRGHEIGSHSVSHRRPEIRKDPQAEAQKSKRWIEDHLGVEIASYCYPFGYITRAIKKAVIGAGYQQARSGVRESYYSSESRIDYFDLDARVIGRHGREKVHGHFLGKYGSEDVNGWIRPRCWHVLTFHGIGTLEDGWWPIPVKEFERQMTELAKHRDSGEVEVVTFQQGADRLRSMRFLHQELYPWK